MKKRKITTKQHYVPQFYLKQWTDHEGGFYPINIISKDPPDLKIFGEKSNPSRFCFENFFYAQFTGTKDDFSQVLEKTFAEVEKTFSVELLQIEKKILNNEQITYSDKHTLSQFMLFLWIRGKQHRESSKKMTEYVFKEMNKRMMIPFMDRSANMQADMKKLEVTREEMIDFIEKGEYNVEFGNARHLSLLKDIYNFANLLSEKFWKVYISRNEDFITTDSPYLDTAKNTEFWGNSFFDRDQSFILSPRVAIVALYPNKDKGKKLIRKDVTNDKATIQSINCYHLMNSIRFGFRKNKNLLEELKKCVAFLYTTNSKKNST